jgi:hypothetical protein
MKVKSVSVKTTWILCLALVISVQGSLSLAGSPFARSTFKKSTLGTDRMRSASLPAEFPLSFEINRGQADPRTKFLAHASGYGISLNATGVAMAFGVAPCIKAPEQFAGTKQGTCNPENAVLRMEFAGASPTARPVGEHPSTRQSNYLIGNNPGKFLTHVKHFDRARFIQVYPGVDVEYYGAHGQLEYDLLIAPGANPQRIAPHFEGVEKVALDAEGNLLLQFAQRQIVQHKPLAYQIQNETRVPVPARYVLKEGSRIGFQLGAYDRTKPLVIDPVLDYSTYLGGSSADTGASIAIDFQGRVYVTGITASVNFPTSGSSSILRGNSDIFITRLNPSGNAIEYSTFIGGQGNEEGTGLAVDAGGNAYVTGTTTSVDFPATAGSFHTTLSGTSDAFVAKLRPDGSGFVYSTFLGGANADEGYGLAIDSNNNVCVTGLTDSDNFPTTPAAFQLNKNNDSAAFVSKLNASGSALLYSSYLGGSGTDWGSGIATDDPGNIYITGVTTSNDFPVTLNALQTTLGGASNTFVAKFVPSETGAASLSYSTFLGGGGSDSGYAVAVDSIGNAYVAGSTNSINFPATNGALQPNKKGSSDAFVAKLNSDASALSYVTYLGGDGSDAALAIQVDSAGQAFVSGFTQSQNFPITPNAYQSTLAGKSDAFIAKLKNDGSGLVVSTYLGGANDEEALGIKVGIASRAYVTGETISDTFPVVAPLQGTPAGAGDVFVTKVTVAETVNPSEDVRFFVRQQYIDFLSREPDQGGWDFWTNAITACGPTDQLCIHNKRIDVSNAFFYELEFQQTGSYVYRLYRVAYGNNQPFPNGDGSNPAEAHKLVAYINFALDRALVVGGSSLAQSQLNFANGFVQRPEFLARYPASLDGPAFVDAVLTTLRNDIGVDISAQRVGLINLFNQGGRGAVLYRLADDNLQTNPIDNRLFIDIEYNRAFVATQYFGYLKRDADIGGFLFWLGQVNSAPLRDVPKQHAMVCSFITSLEYQFRFGALAPHSNVECPP